MTKILVQQTDFRYGKIDKYLLSNIDPISGEKYAKYGLLDSLNFIPNKYNGISRRTGTTFLSQAKTIAARIFDFRIGLSENYFIEFGNLYIRIHTINGIQKDKDNNIIELITPFLQDDLISFTKGNFIAAGSILYIVHRKYGYYELKREKKTNYNIWTFEKMKFKLQLDSFGKPIYCGTPTAISKWQQATGSKMELILETLADSTFAGTITNASNTITTSSSYFTDAMIGSIITGSGIPDNTSIVSITNATTALMSNNATSSGAITITKKNNIITSNNQMNYNFNAGVIYRLAYIGASGLNANQMRVAYIKTTSSGNTAYYQQLGGKITAAGDEAGVPKKTPLPLWEAEEGIDDIPFSSGGCIADQRLIFTGTSQKGSRVNDFTDFGVYEDSVSSTSPFNQSPFKTSDDPFVWLINNDSVLYNGSQDLLYRMNKSASRADVSINYSYDPIQQKGGCGNLPPLLIDSYLLYLDKSGIRLRCAYYESEKRLFQTDEITKTEQNILSSGVVKYEYQANPNDLIFLVKKNGNVVVCKFNNTGQNITYGGLTELSMDNALIKDIVILPNESGKDNIIFAVLRNIDGEDVLYYELYNDYITLHDNIYASNFLDCSITVNAPFNIQESNGVKYVGGFDRLKGQNVYVVFNGNDIRTKRTITSDGRIAIVQTEEINLLNITSITCGLSFETFATVPPVDIFFDGRYSSKGEKVDVVDIKVMYQNSVLCDLYDRLGTLAMEARSLNNNDVLETQEAFIFEYKTRIIGTKTKRNTFFKLKVRESVPLPCNIMGIEYYAEI